MEATRRHRGTLWTSFVFLLVTLLHTSTGQICTSPVSVEIAENNAVGEVLATITADTGVTLALSPDSDPGFGIRGKELLAEVVFDYETDTSHIARIICIQGSLTVKILTAVIVKNVNDNRPVFKLNPYLFNVVETSPVGSFVGNVAATDLDKPNQIFYTLTSESTSFKLRSATNPEIQIASTLDYDTAKEVQLVLTAQDTAPTAPGGTTSFTATTTIQITILDGDNRPPWFQPCNRHVIGTAVICQSPGYVGRVVQNELQTGALTLEPGPLRAIDGDNGINEEISYSILSGNELGLFEMNTNTGSISMLKASATLETIRLTVLARQTRNPNQFSTTSVSISVLLKSLHPPRFLETQYRAVITTVGAMAMAADEDKSLKIIATDGDFADGINPYIRYTVTGSNDFSIIDHFLFMTKDLPVGTSTLEVVARDTSTGDSAKAQLVVEVKSGVIPTTLPLSTTNTIPTTTTTSTSSKTSSKTSTTSGIIISTTKSTVSTTTSASNPSSTSEGSVPTNTAGPPTVIVPSGGYGPGDMAALGVTLAVLLIVCLVVIGVLVSRNRKESANWRKIYEVDIFRSSLGPSSGGLKPGLQYTNDSFQKDEDDGSVGYSGPKGGSEPPRSEAVRDVPLKQAAVRSPPPSIPADDLSLAGSEKEVKPILTKERRMEEGYKAVWFKEDIDPNAKEEVVIIPEEEEEEEEEEEGGGKRRGVSFADSDLDSGLGVRMGDHLSLGDSDGDEGLTSDL